ncbi:MAG: tRNA modification GTPase MnmE [Porticoccaceae bacterium]|nr:MAG: tRNA modification GTPase MnmE [Porticoccaceae bacterium]
MRGEAVGREGDVIAAIATPPGRGGVGIVRISGPDLSSWLPRLTSKAVSPRRAVYTDFVAEDGSLLDRGLLLYFSKPASYTGEDVIELHGHGGPVVMEELLSWVLRLGARPARPGEFTLRAFLNERMDLTQAEAVADLIDAASREAARSALRSLEGAFSKAVRALVDELVELRTFVEAAIDFPEEEVDFLAEGEVASRVARLRGRLSDLLARAREGALLREGMTVAIAGRPNAGKSSLLNALSGRDAAIVTEIPGTTRDLLRETILVDGLPVHLVDTAGLRESEDLVEREGIRRARQELARADRILLVVDAAEEGFADPRELASRFALGDLERLTVLYNKVDLLPSVPPLPEAPPAATLCISAATGAGLDRLREHLKAVMGYRAAGEGGFSARRRHLEHLRRADVLLASAGEAAERGAGELVAEDLRAVQRELGEITGEFTTEDLLDRIFSRFCIGK